MKISITKRVLIFFLYLGFWETIYLMFINSSVSLIVSSRDYYTFKSKPVITIICISLIATVILFLLWMFKIAKTHKNSAIFAIIISTVTFFVLGLSLSQSARSNILFWQSEETFFPNRKFEIIPILILIQAVLFSLLPSFILTEYYDINTYYKPIDHELRKTFDRNPIKEIDSAISLLSHDETKYALLKYLWPFHSIAFEKWYEKTIYKKRSVYRTVVERYAGRIAMIHNNTIRHVIIMVIAFCYMYLTFPFHFFVFFINTVLGSDFLFKEYSFEGVSLKTLSNANSNTHKVNSYQISEYLLLFQQWESLSYGYAAFFLLICNYFHLVFYHALNGTDYEPLYRGLEFPLLLAGVCVFFVSLFRDVIEKNTAYRETEYRDLEKGNKNWMLLFAHQFINSCKSIHESTRIIEENNGIDDTVLSLQFQSDRLQYNSERCFDFAHALNNHTLSEEVDVIKLYYEVIADIEKFPPCMDLWENTKIEFDSDEDESYVINTNKEILHSIIFELFTNAIKFNQNPNPINITISKQKKANNDTKSILSISFCNIIHPDDKEKIQSIQKRINDFWNWNEVTYAGDIQLGLVFVKSYSELINIDFDYGIEHHIAFVATLTFQ